MKRALLRNVSFYTRNLLPSSSTLRPNLNSSGSTRSVLRFYSSENENENDWPSVVTPETSLAETQDKDVSVQVKDVSNKELQMLIIKYMEKSLEEEPTDEDEDENEDDEDGDEVEDYDEPSLARAILQRRLTGEHDDTDSDLAEELQVERKLLDLQDVSHANSDEEEDYHEEFDEHMDACTTDNEIDDLYDARTIVTQRMRHGYSNMDGKKWDEMFMDDGSLEEMRRCEEILEDMQNWDKLLPDEIKKKVEMKFEELGDMCEGGELKSEEAYELFKKFEDEMVMEYMKITEAREHSQSDETAVPDKYMNIYEPPGEGPILRWQTRAVFAPGGDAWHPKNRKVKMSVTVKELGLSKHQFRRLRELVGKRYHPGRDELTITSERFEHRVENRKDCFRTLLSLIQEAAKANKLADDARASYVKERLRANSAFMERLNAKIMRSLGEKAVSA